MTKRYGVNADPLYATWCSMKARCFNKRHSEYCNYGAKGVTVCPAWVKSFTQFKQDMGPKPQGTSLDRFPDNKGNYEPSNCRWATRGEQARNYSKNLRYTLNGKTLCLTDWCAELGLPYHTIRNRVLVQGLSFEDAVSRPIECTRYKST